MHWNLLLCVYPDPDLIASDGQDCHLDVITDTDGFVGFSRESRMRCHYASEITKEIPEVKFSLPHVGTNNQ